MIRFALSILLLLLFFRVTAAAETTEAPRIQAPPFPTDISWLNVTRPLTQGDLRGRVVILDFWTYGCINCLHVAEELGRLETQFGDDLLVIGVHSPKFTNEKRTDMLRQVLLRYDRRHPVIQDQGLSMMKQYGVRAWPTLMLLDTRGRVVGYVTGEGHEKQLAGYISGLLAEDERPAQLSELPLKAEREQLQERPLASPGKVHYADNRLFISDTLHHRVLITDLSGKVLQVIGEGNPGFEDGVYNEARFNNPQGVRLSGTDLYVADTGNHAIRHIDLKRHRVRTLAGTGQIGSRNMGGTNALALNLRSPWDLSIDDRALYIAMAGSHQIWQLRLDTGALNPFAGTGAEGVVDGPLGSSTFSQPSGLSRRADYLYVADSEASALRRIDLKQKTVKRLLGKGLFYFGDRDGKPRQVKLQHPLALASLDEHRILIADTYNHKLKLYDSETDSVTTLVGNGEPGNELKPQGAALSEPGGIATNGRLVWIADTNNHRLLRYDLNSGLLEQVPIEPDP